MADKHLSSQFDSELNGVSARVMELGGLVESQLHQAVYALIHLSLETAEQVIETEQRINQMEVNIDHEIISTIGRRQPTARDLRFLMAISRTTQNLERAGDEIARVARRAGAPKVQSAGVDLLHKLGDSVKQGQTLLIIEAMKTMNPIQAPRDGVIQDILVGDAQPVEFGEPLVILEA